MNKITLTALAATFVLATGSLAVFADTATPNQPAPAATAGAGHHGGGRRLMKELGLSQDQLTKLKSLRQNSRTQAEAIKNDQSLSEADKKSKLKALRQQTKTQLEALLTPEQRTKLAQLRQERREAHENGEGGANAGSGDQQ